MTPALADQLTFFLLADTAQHTWPECRSLTDTVRTFYVEQVRTDTGEAYRGMAGEI
jgi:hypothetical protein